MAASDSPALKEIFSAAVIRTIAKLTAGAEPRFATKRFLSAALADLDALSLMARLRRVAESLHTAMPGDFAMNVATFRAVVPKLGSGFVTLVFPEYVALYGLDDVATSMEALRFFTRFGTSEFAVRHFLRRDLEGGLAVMQRWARDDDEHVRRLASEGSRPRLPWSFQLVPLMRDPTPLAPILEALKADPSAYVRKSVANSLNDITKDNPDWALQRIQGWSLSTATTAWIAKHALRTLIKKGDRRALAIVGAGEPARVRVGKLEVRPRTVALGETVTLAFTLRSTAAAKQRLVVDYAIHYVKKSGAATRKVFKLKTVELEPGASLSVRKTQRLADFTTRVHYAGRHRVEVVINGDVVGRSWFELTT